MNQHNLETHSVTEVNGAGVHTEYWQECTRCHETFGEYDSIPEECPVEVSESDDADGPPCGKCGQVALECNCEEFVEEDSRDAK